MQLILTPRSLFINFGNGSVNAIFYEVFFLLDKAVFQMFGVNADILFLTSVKEDEQASREYGDDQKS